MSLVLTSSAFKDGETIPARYTCDGVDVSPPLHWSVPPAGTKSFVIIADDPDAPGGTWVHWVLYNLPLDLRGLSEGVPTTDHVLDGALQGMNDFKGTGYGGPCPPEGFNVHRYIFTVHAVSLASLPVTADTSAAIVGFYLNFHTLAKASLIGLYKR